MRDEVCDYVRSWAEKAEVTQRKIVAWIGITPSKFQDWQKRFGQVNEHNGLVPRDHWLEPHERQAILDFHQQRPDEGYRRLTYMMLDADIVAVSAASVYRVLKTAGRLARSNWALSKKGTGFVQPLAPHEHWHIDISYINVAGTFFFLCSVLDPPAADSRTIIHWELKQHMTECDVEILLQAAREKFPDARPRIISDNGPQFIAKDFKEFIRLCGMTHVRTSPYYPQSNGKLERWHKSLKTEAVRPGSPLTQEDAQRLIAAYVKHYNTVRLHAAIGYVTPADKLAGRGLAIFAGPTYRSVPDQKLAAARTARQARRQAARVATTAEPTTTDQGPRVIGPTALTLI